MSAWRDSLVRFRKAWIDLGSTRERAPDDVRNQIPLTEIQRVTFYKRNELTTDLICCDIEARGETWFFHEEAEGWDDLLRHLEQLPTFKRDWYEAVVHPPFATCDTVAFRRD